MRNRPIPPPSVTIPGFFVLLITGWNALRVYGAITNWTVLNEFGANPTYILITGAVWLLAGIWLLGNLLRRSIRVTRLSIGLSILYYCWYWYDRLFFQVSPSPNVLFSAVFSTALLILLIITITSSSIKAFLYKEK